MAPTLSRRTAITAGLAVTTAAVTGADAIASDHEWPEFRKWYALVQEQEQIYNQVPAPDADDERLRRIADEADLLESAMLARKPRSLTDVAVLGVIALYWSDSFGSVGGKVRCLDLTASKIPTDCRKEQSQANFIGATLQLALDAGLLPGVTIHGTHSPQQSGRA